MLIILKVIAWILLSLVSLVIIALIIPATLELKYAGGRFSVAARYLIFKFTIFDTHKKKKTEAKKESEKEEDESGKDKSEPKGDSKFDLELIKKLLKPGAKTAWRIVRSLRLRDVHIVIVAKGKDSADVGINTGRAWAAIGVGIELLDSVWKRVVYKEISVIPDFMGDNKISEKYSCKITALPIILVICGLDFLFKYSRIKGVDTPKTSLGPGALGAPRGEAVGQ